MRDPFKIGRPTRIPNGKNNAVCVSNMWDISIHQSCFSKFGISIKVGEDCVLLSLGLEELQLWELQLGSQTKEARDEHINQRYPL